MEITFENVRDIIVDTLSCDADQVQPDTNLFEELDADSLEAVELSLALEEAFGVGIADEDLPNIKQKFYKANRSRPGSGIGLALADEIVKRHKGRLDIDSEEGVGTTVTIMLPVAPPELLKAPGGSEGK